MKIKLDKKHKYLIHSLFVGLMIFLFVIGPADVKAPLAFLNFLVVIAGTFITQYPNIKWRNLFYTILTPLVLVTGALLSFTFFPNLSLIFKLGAIISVTTLFYIYSLVNNVFLVVEDKKDVIPLYRVAVTSSYIVLSIVGIPLFAGIFKVSIVFWLQSLLASFSSMVFILYAFWITKYDVDAKRLSNTESVFLCVLTFFIIFIFSSSVAFIPTEPFLRAIFTASGLMFCIGLVQSHLKNSIDKVFIRQFFIVFAMFLVILVVFNP